MEQKTNKESERKPTGTASWVFGLKTKNKVSPTQSYFLDSLTIKENKSVSRHILLLIVIFLFTIYPLAVLAMPFGTYDPRSIAMGGAGVASGNSANAVFFNPALLAQYTLRKHRARNSHYVFPVASLSVSKVAEDIVDLADNNPEQVLSNSIASYNANSTLVNAEGVLTASRNLQSDLGPVTNESIFFDGIIGMVIGIGDRQEGGAFVVSRRFVGDGIADQTTADKQLLVDYIESLNFIVSGGANGVLNPELFDANGNLLDQTNNLTSTVTGRGLLLTELGIAMSWGIEWFRNKIDVGFTPKFVQGTTYEYNSSLGNSQLNATERKENDDWQFTLDMGVSKVLDNKLKLGLVVKNLVPLEFSTQSGGRINIQPQLRAGAAYPSVKWGYWALDVDVLENRSIGGGDNTQYLSLGGEWLVKNWILRAGYKQNLVGRGDFSKGVFTTGLAYRFMGVGFDVAYVDSGPEKAAALQVSRRF